MSRKSRSAKRLFLIASASAVLMTLTTACELFAPGLGSKVDVSAPVVKATSFQGANGTFDAAAIPYLRGNVTLSGTASDDRTIKSVAITYASNSDLGTSTLKAHVSGTTWSVTIPAGLDEADANWADSLAEGEQNAIVTATDNSGKTSSISMAFYVDNIAPTVLATSPQGYGDEYRTTFYRLLDIKGEVWDASPLSEVVVDIVNLSSGTVLDSATADGTNTWSVRFDYSSSSPLSNDTDYGYRIHATDEAGNTNTWYYHRSDIYTFLEDTDGDGFVVFPSMNQIGKLEQTALASVDGGLDKADLASVRHGEDATASQEFADFTYMNEDAPKVQWLNIDGSSSAISLGGMILGTILPPSDGSAVKPSSIVITVAKRDTDMTFMSEVTQTNVTLTAVSSSLNFQITPHDSAGDNIKSGNYRVTMSYITTASSTVKTATQEFGVSAGIPTLTETGVGGSSSPSYLQKIINGSVTLSGKSRDSSDESNADLTLTVDSGTAQTVTLGTDGSYSVTVPAPSDGSNDGSHSYVLTATGNGISTSIYRSFVIDTQAPTLSVTTPTAGQAVDGSPSSSIAISGLANDTWDDSGTTVSGSGIAAVYWLVDARSTSHSSDADPASTWNTAGGTISWSGTQSTASLSEGLLTLWLCAVDQAGNETRSSVDFAYDMAAPVLDEAAWGSTDTAYRNSDLVFSGTLTDTNTAGAPTLAVTVNGGSSNAITVTAGTWSWTFDTDAPSRTDGLYTLAFTATDTAGRTSTLTRTVRIDKTAPGLTITVPSSYQSGTINASGTASDTNLSTVDWQLGSTTGTWTDASGTTSWLAGIDLSGAAEGTVLLYVRATDRAGNETISSASIKVDRSNPVATMTVGGSGGSDGSTWLRKADFTLSGDCNDGTVTSGRLPKAVVLQVSKDGATASTLTLTSGGQSTGTWTYDQSVDTSAHADDGLYVYTLTVTDDADKTATATVTLRIDTTSPTLVIQNPETGTSFTTSSVTISGLATDDGSGLVKSTVTYSLDSDAGVTPSFSGSTWSATIDLGTTEGSHTLSLTGTDKLGNSTTVGPNTFYLDKYNPVVTETAIGSTGQVFVKTATATLSGALTDTNEVSAVTLAVSRDGTELTAPTVTFTPAADSKSADWSSTVSLDTDGTYLITVTGTDTAGKTHSVQRTVVRDTTAPVLSGVTTLSGWYKVASQTISGTVTDALSGVAAVEYCLDYSDNGDDTDDTWLAFTGTSSFTGTITFPEGAAQILKIRARDNAGNTTSPLVSQTLSVDSQIPSVDDLSVTEDPVNGTADLAVTVDLSDATSGLATLTGWTLEGTTKGTERTLTVSGTSATGTILTIPAADILALTAGTRKIQVKVSDQAGNISAVSSVNILVDKTAPTVTFSSHSDGSTINKSLSLSGTASDANGLSSTLIQINNKASATWESLGTQSGDAYAWASLVDSTLFGDGGDYDQNAAAGTTSILVRALSTDRAGNQTAVTRTLTVDQDADRPIVKLTNLATDGTGVLKQTTTITGIVTDDDGITTLKARLASSSDWATLTLENGSFSWDLTIDDDDADTDAETVADGAHQLLFQVTDTVGTAFESDAASSLDRPRVQTATGTYTGLSVSFRLDTVNPEFDDLVYTSTDGSTWTEATTTNSWFGAGDTDSLQLRFGASDANGMASGATVTVTDSTGYSISASATGTLGSTTATYTGAALDLSSAGGLAEGQSTLTMKITDASGLTSSKSRSIYIDRTAPDITFLTPSSGSQLNGEVTVKGTTSDSMGSDAGNLALVSYKLGANHASESWTAFSSTSSWQIAFTGSNSLDIYASNGDSGHIDGESTDTDGDGIWTFPILIRAVDKAGNVTTTTDGQYYLLIDPSGDSPKATIAYPVPADGSETVTLGGKVRVTGTATDDDAVYKVYMMVDTDDDGDYTDETSGGNGTEWYNSGTGIAVTSSNSYISWYKDINVSGELDPTSGTTRTVTVKVRAVDTKDGSTASVAGAWVSTRITFDSTVPTIGSSQPVVLSRNTTYGDSDDVAYTPGMYLAGDWYILGSVEDESAVSDIQYTLGSTTYTLASQSSWFTNVTLADDQASYPGKYKRIDFAIPVTTTAGATYTLTPSLTAYDEAATPHTTTLSFRFNVDNEAPSGTFTATTPVIQDDGNYKVAGTADDGSDGSGIANIQVYFVRYAMGSSTTGRFYLPTPDETSGSTVTRGDFTSVPTATFSNGDFIYPSESSWLISIDYDGQEDDDSHDSDGFTEKLKLGSGTTYNWNVDMNSLSIPDGPLEIHYVVTDEAGNTWHGVVSTAVHNSGPSMTGIITGTDLDGDGSIDTSDGSGEASTWVLTDGSAATTFVMKAAPSCLLPVVTGGNGILYYRLTESTSGFSRNGILRASGSGAIDQIELSETELTTIGDGQVSFTLTIWDSTEETLNGSNDANAGTPSSWDTASWTSLSDSGTFSLRTKIGDTVAPVLTVTPFHWTSSSDNSLYGNSRSNGHIELTSVLGGTGPDISGQVRFTGTAFDNSGIQAIYAWIGNTNSTMSFGSYLTTDTAYDVNGVKSDAGDGRSYVKVASYTAGTWTLPASATMAGNGWTFTASSTSLDQQGHDVAWELDWDSSFLPAVADSDVSARLLILDRKGNVSIQTLAASTSTAATALATGTMYRITSVGTSDFTLAGASANTVGTVFTAYGTTTGTGTAESLSHTPYMTFDVAPYVSTVGTKLSSLKTNNPSVYNRTALGKYPVNTSETITLSGFNLTGATVTGLTGVTVASGVVSVPMTSASTGNLPLLVNGMALVNNLSDNNLEYNQVPNGDNNENLTDDVNLDVWQFNSRAAVPISGRVDNPVMKVNPSSGMIGFAFANGPLYYSMGGTVSGTEYSYMYWQGSYDFFTSIAFAYDSAGKSYGASAGGDINSASADKFSFKTDRWGKSGLASSGSYGNTNALRMESIGQNNSGTYDFNKYRIKSPEFATARHGTSTNVYMAYFDDMNNEIRFHYGNLADGAASGNFGMFQDTDSAGTPPAYSTTARAILAGSTTGRNAGQYLSIGVVPGASQTTDVVVMTWYDPDLKTLWYTYSTASTSTTTGVSAVSNWSTPIAIFSEAGEYCKLAVDAGGGIHIAAYDIANADLVYAYLSSYSDTGADTCVVDSYGIVGTEITIDTASDGTNYIPYIGYYAPSSIRPKYAYLVDTSSKAPAGATNDAFTGAWEITLVPTTSTVPADHINAAVWKTSAGVLKNSVTGTSSYTKSGSGYSATNYGFCYGNGTSNGVLAYQITESTNGYIETAQKK